MDAPPDISAPDISISDISVSDISAYDGPVTPPMQALLRAADPDARAVAAYLAQGQVYICGAADAPYGLMVLLPHAPEGAHVWEVKNIATATQYQGRGIASAMLHIAKQAAQAGGARALMIGTGNSSLAQLRLYQRLGFRMESVVPDFFANYPEPIYENAILCRDMVRLRYAFDPH